MTSTSKWKTTIVAGVEPNADAAIWVLDRTFDEALRRHPADVHLLCVVSGRHSSERLDDARNELMSVAANRLEIFAELEEIDLRIHAHARSGHAAEEIALLAAEVGADLICVGAAVRRKHGVPTHLLDIAECPVLVERPREYPKPRVEPKGIVCPACERVRAASGDPTRLCFLHSDEDLPMSAVLVPHARMPMRPGGLH